MSARDTTRFFDTSGCLNLARANGNGARTVPARRPHTASAPIRGQMKIDLYNFDHLDFADSKYVLTSPRSLEACARLNVKPAALLPTKLADLTSDKVRFSTLVDIRDEIEMERLANLQRCREEREKIIAEQAVNKPTSTQTTHSKPSHANNRSVPQRNSAKTNSQPSSALLRGLNRVAKVPTESNSLGTGTTTHHSHYESHGARTVLKPTVAQWPSSDDQEPLRNSSSASFLDDVRRMDQHLQRVSTSHQTSNEHYVHGLENAKQMIEQRATQSTSGTDIDHATFEKKQYDLLLGHYDHELKIQKARENARRTEKEKEAERHELMMHDFLDQTMAEERRQNELRRRMDKLHHSRQLFDTLQAKNHELQMADVEKRRAELLQDIKRKDRRTDNFVKDKQDTVHLSRTLAKSSQDTREYLRENNENFDQKAKRAELTSSVLVPKPKVSIERRHLQTSIRS